MDFQRLTADLSTNITPNPAKKVFKKKEEQKRDPVENQQSLTLLEIG